MRRPNLRRAGSTDSSIDHGALSGLADNDHPQYFLKASDVITNTNHGNRAGGSLHAAAVAGVSDGFMTAAMATTLAGAVQTSTHTGMSVLGVTASSDGALADITGAGSYNFLGANQAGTAIQWQAITGDMLAGFVDNAIPYADGNGGLENDETKLYFNSSTVALGIGGTASHRLDVTSAAAAVVTSALRNTNDAAGAGVRQLLSVAGASSGDVVIQLSITGATDWAMGVKQSSDNFIIGRSATLGTTQAIEIIQSNRNVAIGPVGGNHRLDVTDNTAGALVTSAVRSTSNSASAGARSLIEAAGTSSTADAYSEWSISGGQSFTAGIDVSVSATTYVFAASSALGTTNVYLINSAGEMSFGTGVPVSGEKLRIRTAGDTDVGVETTSTSNKATLKAIAGALSARLVQYGTTAAGTTNGVNNTSLTLVQTSAGNIMFTAPDSSSTIYFATNGAIAGRITGNTNLVLGVAATTDVASSKLRIDNAKTIASGASAVWDGIDVIASTATLSGSTNITTATGFNLVALRAPTISAASALTITAAATLYIAGAPAGAGAGPATLTNAYAVWVDAGLARFDGNGTYIFEFPEDATVGAGAHLGRIPIKTSAGTRYIRTHAD